MKQLANLVAFNPTTRVVDFGTSFHYIDFSLDQLLLIVNATRNEVIYNIADPALGAEDFEVISLPSSVLFRVTLKAPCTGHDPSDKISIFFDDKVNTTDWIQGPDVPAVRTILYANDSGGEDNSGHIVSSANPLPVAFPTSQAVTGPLTDAELRDSPVPVSGTVTANVTFPTSQAVTGPLTDAELRDSPVPVSGTVTANVTFPASQPTVSTPVTIIQIPGTAPGISNEVLPQNLSRRYLLIQNLSNEPFYINFSGTATPSSLRIDGLGSLTFESGVVPTNAIQMLRSTADQKYVILHA